MIEITITGQPVAKGRGRVGKLADGRPVVFTPAKTRAWERDARHVARQEMFGRDLVAGAIELQIVAVFPVPQSWPNWKREAAAAGEVGHTTKPDGDNITKAVKDAFNGVVWLDDAQVVRTTIEKQYGPKPMVHARIQPLALITSQTKSKAELLERKTA